MPFRRTQGWENKLSISDIRRRQAVDLVAEHLETFTIDARKSDVRELSIKYLTGFNYRFSRDEDHSLIFEMGSKRKNVYTTSFEEAYKKVRVSLVGNENAPVTTVSVLFKLPLLRLRKDEIEGIRSLTKALREFILISVGYQST